MSCRKEFCLPLSLSLSLPEKRRLGLCSKNRKDFIDLAHRHHDSGKRCEEIDVNVADSSVAHFSEMEALGILVTCCFTHVCPMQSGL